MNYTSVGNLCTYLIVMIKLTLKQLKKIIKEQIEEQNASADDALESLADEAHDALERLHSGLKDRAFSLGMDGREYLDVQKAAMLVDKILQSLEDIEYLKTHKHVGADFDGRDRYASVPRWTRKK